AETLYQWPYEEAVGRNLQELIVPPELQAAAAEVISQVAGRGFWEGEFNVRRKDGSTFAAHIVDAVLRDSELRHIGYVCVSMDVTERKRAEQTLRQSEGRFSAFIDNLPGFAWIKDLTGRYLFLSPDRGQRQDHPPDWKGKTAEELWPRELSEEYKRNDEKVMATGQPVQTIESYYRGGQQAYALVSKFPILDARGKVSMIGGIAVDVTDRKEAEERVRRSEEQLHELAMRLQGAREEESLRIAREIHDVLGQALTSLNMDLTSLRDETDKGVDLQLRASFRRRIKAMQTLLKGTVKSVQRISSELRPGLLDDLGLSAALEWQAQEFERRTKIRCRWKRKPPLVDLNPTQSTALFRIFQEALTNVARHARARRVNLELEHQAGFLVLEISDDGKGFRESKVFTQDSLGLLGMRERANLIGAGFQIRSAPKKGTVVTVALATQGPPANSKVHDRSKPIKNSHRR
ncbi:MAG TPA: PAS domain S-box protein, partial [Methylomirabilota bacterium]|nr:PAS domain S-box protein [Methylomirabilota bacterium]